MVQDSRPSSALRRRPGSLQHRVIRATVRALPAVGQWLRRASLIPQPLLAVLFMLLVIPQAAASSAPRFVPQLSVTDLQPLAVAFAPGD
jgi:hypothetical protein